MRRGARSGQASAGMVPRDVYELTGVADPRLSPDGSTVACVVSGVDEVANDYRSAIWLAAADGSSPPRQFTCGAKQTPIRAGRPDGAHLAFTSNRDGKASQLYVMPVDGGEPRRLTGLKEDVTRRPGPRTASRPRLCHARPRCRLRARRTRSDARPRRFTRLQYKLDTSAGRRPAAAPLRRAADGSTEAVQLTDGDYEDCSPAWSPDGATIAFVSARHEDWDTESGHRHLPGRRRRRRAAAAHAGRRLIDHVSWSRTAPPGRRARPWRARRSPAHQVAVVDARTATISGSPRSLDLNCAPTRGPREPLWDDGEPRLRGRGPRPHARLSRRRRRLRRARLLVGGERKVTGLDVVGGHLVFTAWIGAPQCAVRRRPVRRVGRPRLAPSDRRRRLRRRARARRARALHRRLGGRQRGRRVDHAARRLRGG